jgi:hypothetical protein
LKDEDSWLGSSGIQKRENLAKKIEEKQIATEMAAKKAEEGRLRLEQQNTDRTRVGVFDPDVKIVEENRRRKEEMQKPEEEGQLDPRVSVFYRRREGKGEASSSSWFGWMNWKTGEQKESKAEPAK